jgi:hypothetical protein
MQIFPSTSFSGTPTAYVRESPTNVNSWISAESLHEANPPCRMMRAASYRQSAGSDPPYHTNLVFSCYSLNPSFQELSHCLRFIFQRLVFWFKKQIYTYNSPWRLQDYEMSRTPHVLENQLLDSGEIVQP